MRKTCENCKQTFECNMENITQCQCYGIPLNENDKAFVASKFNDCLCRNCLLLVKEK